MQASLALEREAYAAGNTLLARLGEATRRERLRWLNVSTDGLYGAGFLSRRQFASLRVAINEVVTQADRSRVDAYRELLRYLARVPEWSARWLEFHFSTRRRALRRHRAAGPPLHPGPPAREPAALLRRRPRQPRARREPAGGSARRALRREHRRRSAGPQSGPRARDHPRAADAEDDLESFDRDGIYLLPETTSDLPPVAGILTRGEGSSLSHVQLLARNLGIPNVVVTDALLPTVQAHVGRPAVLAVSPGGVVQLSADGPQLGRGLRRGEASRPPSRSARTSRSSTSRPPSCCHLSQLRATDSGRTSGPKGANLGELKHYFGDAVPGGVVIPFGIFRKLLDQPLEPGGPPVFEWMKRDATTRSRSSTIGPKSSSAR